MLSAFDVSYVMDDVAMGQVNLGIHQFPLSVIPPMFHIHIHSSVTWGQENGSIKTTVLQRPRLSPVRMNKIFSYLFVRPIECAPRKWGELFAML
jgi:hypothetical protein